MTPILRIKRLLPLAVTWACVIAVPISAQTARSASAVFADASAKEAAVRKALTGASPKPTLLRAVRTVVRDYETVAQRHPASDISDDALWRAARLSRDAFDTFGQPQERAEAVRLLGKLAAAYPTSTFTSQTSDELARLKSAPGAGTAVQVSLPLPKPMALTEPVAKAPRRATKAAPITPKRPAELVSIKAIRRTIMPDVVRVTIELDGEVNFHDERLDGPTRVFVDLPSTSASQALRDNTLRFDEDSDIVRLIRVGRHPNDTTRVVLEGSGIASYSVYPRYSPYRLVIDCVRSTPSRADAQALPLVSPQAPAALPTATAAQRAATLSQTPPPAAGLARAGAPVGTIPAAASATAAAATPSATPTTDRPAWATTLQKRTAPVPVLRSKRVNWRLPLPANGAVLLPVVAEPAPQPELVAASTPLPLRDLTADDADGVPAVGASASSDVKVTAPPLPIAAAPPASNVAGGLSIARQLGLGVSRIVIDPGHGGHDPGALGPGVTESELVLDVALRLEKLLTKQPGVEVILTRRDDDFIALQQRTAIANREGADLFLSIHANASKTKTARGVETYFLNFASSRMAAEVAARENATSGQTMGELQDVVKAIALSSKRDESRDFATYVQREMMSSLKASNKTLRDLGVKQAPFVVLVGASMPSVLAEISFITNPQDAKLLKSSAYRQRIAQALFEGVRRYQGSLKTAPAVAQQQD